MRTTHPSAIYPAARFDVNGASLPELIRSSGWPSSALLALVLVSMVFRISLGDLLSPRRCNKDVCQARRIAMYLIHTTGQHRAARIARMFRRDPSTISHALGRTETERDDPVIDSLLDILALGVLAFGQHPACQNIS